MASVNVVMRAWTVRIHCLALGWAGWAAAPALVAQSAEAERSVPRISVVPSAPAAKAGGETELLPFLPTDDAVTPVRKVPAASVIALPPDVPPLGLPSDGEQAPSFPDLPDLPEASLLPQTPADEAAPGLPPVPANPGDNEGVPPSTPAARPAGLLPPPPPDGSPFPVWHESPKKARALAEAEKRCLLLVFSSSQGEAGGASRQLSDEVLASPAFNQFAFDHLVLCGLYYTKSSSLDLNYPDRIARIDAMAAFKKAFRVRGFPCAILFGPDGREIKRWSGYVSGRGQGVAQQIRQAVEGHEAVLFASDRRRALLTAKGYRTWTSAQGTPIFAKLLEFNAETALLRDEAGEDRTVRLKQLALPDRELITRQRLGKPLPERAAAESSSSAETTLR